MTAADVLIVLVMLGSTIIGLLRGFVREAVSLVFWVVAIWAAWKFGPIVEPHLGGLLVGLMIIGGELLHLNHEEWWNRAKLVPYGETVGDWLRAMVGEKGEPWAKLERLTGVKVRP
jgi:uncharacterized membrane protein required for colicin V production